MKSNFQFNNHYKNVLDTKGWIVYEGFIKDEEYINKLKKATKESFRNCELIREQNGVSENNEGTVHHLIGQDSVFSNLLEDIVENFDELFKWYFKSNYILNAFGGNFLKPDYVSYANAIHRDVRTYTSDVNLMINTLVMLDDFTQENGATFLLNNSHLVKSKPSDEYFYANAEQVIAPKGSILFFNSNVWHAAGVNKTNVERSSITPMFTKTFVKPQFDYLTNLIEKNIEIKDSLKQVLGYKSRVPKDLNEWYRTKDKRFYQPDQEIEI
jgi:hypothetical protein